MPKNSDQNDPTKNQGLPLEIDKQPVDNVPFTVICLVDGNLSQIKQRPTKIDALGLAIDFASECDTPLDEIANELKEDGNFVSNDGSIKIYITQVRE